MDSLTNLLEDYARFLRKSISIIEEGVNPNHRTLNPRNHKYYEIGNEMSIIVRELKKTRLNDIMSGKNVDQSLPPNIKELQDRLIALLGDGMVGVMYTDVYLNFKDEKEDFIGMKRYFRRYNNNSNKKFNKWYEANPDVYSTKLYSYLKSINQEAGRRLNRQRSRRYRKKSKNTRRH